MPAEKRTLPRRTFSYYMRLMDESSNQLVGYLTDISTGGFKVDSALALPANKDFRLRIELTNEVASKTYMVFQARSRWCQTDAIDPTTFNVGFQITNMTAGDFEIFLRMFEKYGAHSTGTNNKTADDYRWR
ncbi:MAG: PilZ domain-containing protein [Anaerolineales bacterium]|nr:PilZ domain-containing protein [Anaerolineales bacterium]